MRYIAEENLSVLSSRVLRSCDVVIRKFRNVMREELEAELIIVS